MTQKKDLTSTGSSRCPLLPLRPSYSHLYPTTSRFSCLLLIGIWIVANVFIGLVEGCQISELYCDNKKCIGLDKYCNGIDDCGDGSDEPRHCSPCNRTFYGEVGSTFSIAVHRPSSRESQLPFVCQLTFAAGGEKFGDLVQLIFNSVTLGPPSSSSDQERYSSEKGPLCKEGHVTLIEPDRPATSGHWCGHDWGQAVFFSETSRVTLTLSLFNIPANPGTFAFDFKLSYKFIKKVDASVRYGPPSRPYFRGRLLDGTFCSWVFNSCDKLRCALQTPNFPGLYPRNVTCYYAVKQIESPAGHRAVVQLGQEKDNMIFIRNRAVSKKNAFVSGGYSESGGHSGGSLTGSDSSMGGKNRVDELTIGDECDASSDHVTVYDGYTTREPVLLRFCGGGRFPTITSSGNEILMEFYSAPTDYLMQTSGRSAIQGFHVDVDIIYLPVGSHTYVENHKCMFTVSSFQQKRGFLTSPQHSLPSGTTCTYLLEGSPGEIVWLSLLKFYIGKEYGKSDGDIGGYNAGSMVSSSGAGMGPSSSGSMGGGQTANRNEVYLCNTTYLQIWQGTYNERNNNATLVAHICEETPVKRTCEFMLSSSSKTPKRACHPEESFISTGPHMSLNLKVESSTVLQPVEFKLYYEFVDTRQDGEAFIHPLITTSSGPGKHKHFPNLPKSLPFKTTSTLGYSTLETSNKFDMAGCSRIFRSQNRAIQAGSFTSPRNVFYFGRGGVRNLTCIYRFQGGRHERVKVTFNKISLPGGFCKAETEPNSGRSICRDISLNDTSSTTTSSSSRSSTVTQGQVQLWEAPWNNSRILKECLCETGNGPVSFVSTSATMDIVLMIKYMEAFHDQNHFSFEGRYEFLKHPDCPRQQNLKGPSGSFTLKVPEKAPHQSCINYPWAMEPQTPSHYIFLMIPGRTMKKYTLVKSKKSSTPSERLKAEVVQKHCDTRNRILVYSGGFTGRLLQIICPEDSSSGEGHSVQIFSEGWDVPNLFPNFVENPHLTLTSMPLSSQLIVELVSLGPPSTAQYDVKWVQISRRDEPLEWTYNSSPGSSILTTSGGVSGGSVVTTSGGSIIGIDGGHKIITPGDPSVLPGSSSSSSSSIASSSILNELEEDVCFKFKCPELNACISPSLFCDGVEHCPSGWDEAECEFFPIPRTYLILAAASIVTIIVLSCCFGCLVCRKRREERREKLLMSSRTPTEEMFFGTGTTSGSHHREIVC